MDPVITNQTTQSQPPIQPPKNFPPLSTAGGAKRKTHNMLIAAIIIIVIILVAGYVLFMRNTLPITPRPALPEGPNSMNIQGDQAGPSVNLENDSTASIESDLNSTDMGNIDSEFNAADKEIGNL